MSDPLVPSARWLTALRTVITAQTVVTFLAAIAAGLLLSVHGGKALHSATAYTLFVVAVIQVVVAVLAWRPGRGPAWPAIYAVALLAGVSLQVVLGIAHLKALHVPFGVLLFGASVLELAWIWMPRRTVRMVA